MHHTIWIRGHSSNVRTSGEVAGREQTDTGAEIFTAFNPGFFPFLEQSRSSKEALLTQKIYLSVALLTREVPSNRACAYSVCEGNAYNLFCSDSKQETQTPGSLGVHITSNYAHVLHDAWHSTCTLK